MRHLSHKIRIYPSNKAITYFVMCFGVARFAYNWALAQCKQDYSNGEKCPSGYDLSKRLNAVKIEEFPWMQDVSKWAPQKAIYNLSDAFKRFFGKNAKFPKFKKKGKCRDSFYTGVGCFTVSGNRIKLPKIGWVRMSQELRFPGRPLSAVVSRKSGRFFVSIHVEVSDDWVYPHTCKSQVSVGVDLGIKDLAVLSNGEVFSGPKSLRVNEGKIKRIQRALSRKRKGSKNRSKTMALLTRVHSKIRDIRRCYTHNLTSSLVRDFRLIGIEDLNIRGMLKNHKLARSISDSGWFEFRRQLEYKSIFSGSVVATVDRFFPSSKMCSSCGEHKGTLQLSERKWTCAACGADHDRDVNAAKNIKVEAARRYWEAQNACGEEVRPKCRRARGHFSQKQEGGISC